MESQVVRLRRAVRYVYDLQKLRIQFNNRNSEHQDGTGAHLDEGDKAFLGAQSEGLHRLEKEALKEVGRLLKDIPIYTWLKQQKGCGPTLSGVIVSEIDIAKAPTVSALWSYAGLAVVDGQAPRPKKGQKLRYNPFLKIKLVKVLGDSFLKCNSPWRQYFDNYKHRKENTIVQVCMACNGAKLSKSTEPGERAGKCLNCNGTGGPAPWGKSGKHRQMAATRYMVKMFLMELWKEWRTLEGLPTPPPYAEAYLGRVHGDHQGSLAGYG